MYKIQKFNIFVFLIFSIIEVCAQRDYIKDSVIVVESYRKLKVTTNHKEMLALCENIRSRAYLYESDSLYNKERSSNDRIIPYFEAIYCESQPLEYESCNGYYDFVHRMIYWAEKETDIRTVENAFAVCYLFVPYFDNIATPSPSLAFQRFFIDRPAFYMKFRALGSSFSSDMSVEINYDRDAKLRSEKISNIKLRKYIDFLTYLYKHNYPFSKGFIKYIVRAYPLEREPFFYDTPLSLKDKRYLRKFKRFQRYCVKQIGK